MAEKKKEAKKDAKKEAPQEGMISTPDGDLPMSRQEVAQKVMAAGSIAMEESTREAYAARQEEDAKEAEAAKKAVEEAEKDEEKASAKS